MLSVRKINAGCGYEYLTRSVAHNDYDQKPTKLSDYYQAKGTPPGRWLGEGLSSLSGEIAPGDVVEAEQMSALFGEGLHPNAYKELDDGKSFEQVKLGRLYPQYTGDDPVLVALKVEERQFKIENGRIPTPRERSRIAFNVGASLFAEEHGREPRGRREVLDWVNDRKSAVRQGVAGYDLTFSPEKSISVLWALADEDTASAISSCHHDAVKEVLDWANGNVIYTRSGRGGVVQDKTCGLIAAEFTHFDTRGGDPDLHSHVVIANKVRGRDGKWRSVDGAALLENHQVLSFKYDAILAHLLRERLGITFDVRDNGDGKEATYTVACVSEQARDLFSKRRRDARVVYDQLVNDYREKYGSVPSKRTSNRLWQEAILSTRNAKREPESLSELRAQWMQEAIDNLGKSSLDGMLMQPKNGIDRRPFFSVREHFDELARDSLETVTRRRAVFKRSHVETAVSGKLTSYCFNSVEEMQDVQAQVVEHILDMRAVSITDESASELPGALVRSDGKRIDYRYNEELYTTTDTVAAEQAVLDSAHEPVSVCATRHHISEALSAHEQREGWSLNSGQVEMVHHLASTGTLAACAVGAAGTGKTASMAVLADTWRRQGNTVHGLAPSAQAARVLANDIGVSCDTIDSLVFTWQGKHPTKPGHDVAALPVQIKPGDMLLVDEAGMASTRQLSALVEIARETGAVVRFVGDHQQLQAVESGGLFGALVRDTQAPELTQVVRFKDDDEQSRASLNIRLGKTSGLEFYSQRGWIHGGLREEMINAAIEDYYDDTNRGLNSVIVAATNSDVDTINSRIQAERIERGQVSLETTVTLARGEHAGVGDRIVCRKNARIKGRKNTQSTTLINGDTYTIEAVNKDGSIVARDHKGDRRRIPSDYVAAHTHLGYAATVYRSQGMTVDVTRAVIDDTMNRAGLYVAATRGRYANHLYTVCEHRLDEEAEQAHEHGQGETPALTPQHVLERIIVRGAEQSTAVETIRKAQTGQLDPEREEKLTAYAHGVLTARFIDSELSRYLDGAPKVYATMIDDDPHGREAIAQTWRQLLDSGVDPREHMTVALDHCDEYKDVTRGIVYELRKHLPDTAPTAKAMPPLTDAMDAELYQWCSERRAQPARKPAPEIPSGALLEGENFAEMSFAGRHLDRVRFTDCDLSRADFTDAELTGTKFTRCSLAGAKLTGAGVGSDDAPVKLINCDLEGADLTKTRIGNLQFNRVKAVGVKLSQAVVHQLKAVLSELKDLAVDGLEVVGAVDSRSNDTDDTWDAVRTPEAKKQATEQLLKLSEDYYVDEDPRSVNSASARTATWQSNKDDFLEL